MIKFSQISQKIVAFSVASTTAGTRFNVAHGLGYTPALNAVSVEGLTTNDNTDNAVNFSVVSADITNVVLKPGRTIGSTVQGRLHIALEEQGPVNNARP